MTQVCGILTTSSTHNTFMKLLSTFLSLNNYMMTYPKQQFHNLLQKRLQIQKKLPVNDPLFTKLYLKEYEIEKDANTHIVMDMIPLNP